MTIVPITDVGSVGIVKDVPAHLLPPEAWTEGKNVRFRNNRVIKFQGDRLVFDPPTVAPHWAMAVANATNTFWIYTGLDDVYTFQGGTHSKITRSSGVYTGTLDDYWDGGILGGIPIINNGVDDPQQWSPIGASTLLVDLTNWPAATTCKVIKPFRNHLIALNVTKSGTAEPHLVKWSQPADPGSVPSSWDETDATKDAGENELDDINAGVIRDGVALSRGLFVIYKDNSIWGMQFTGGRFIWRFDILFPMTGILGHRCVVGLPRIPRHFVMTGDDIVVHDGRNMQSVLDKKQRKFLNQALDPTNFARSFCVLNTRKDEAWACFPEVGSTHPTCAIVWNYIDNTLGIRTLKEAAFINSGVVSETASDTFDGGPAGSFDTDSGPFDVTRFNPAELDLLQCDPVNTKFLHLDQTNQFNSVDISTSIERTDLAIVGRDRKGQPIIDITRRKLAKRIWVRATGGPLSVRIGAQEELGGAVTYQPAQTFTPGVDKYLDFTANGRLLAVLFESNADVAWELEGYDLEVELLGEN